MKPLRVAILGAGFAGTFHAQAWAECAGAEIAAVVDAEPARAREVAERFGGEPAGSLERALAGHVDVVDVCLPTVLHEEATTAALVAGKHVLCEKPIALDLAAAGRMLAVAREAGAILMVAHVLRFWPEYERLAELSGTGELGPLRALTCARLVARPGPYAPWLLDPQRGLGLGEVAVHDLDIAAALLGRPRSVVATGVRDETGWSHLQALLRFDGGRVATVEAGWHVPEAQPFAATYRAVCQRGIVEYDSRRQPTLSLIRDQGAEEVDVGAAGKTAGGPWAFDAAGYVREVEYFAGCVRERREPERCPPEAGRQALELTLAVLESAASRQELALAVS
ncbi:MAG: Gfo/Idh/MocA family oxidoreductase [Thermoleophilia bacterium]|nr:Gfo/Idh/MocA family oxidoreductase [Thermoleophilia bacterium]